MAGSSQAAAATSKMIGIQVGAVSFVDEGVNKVLDVFQQAAYVNTLFVATFTYGRGIAGRQVPGRHDEAGWRSWFRTTSERLLKSSRHGPCGHAVKYTSLPERTLLPVRSGDGDVQRSAAEI